MIRYGKVNPRAPHFDQWREQPLHVETSESIPSKVGKFSREEVQFILANHMERSDLWIALKLGRSVKSIQNKLYALKRQGFICDPERSEE